MAQAGFDDGDGDALTDDDIVILIDFREKGMDILQQLPYNTKAYPYRAVTAEIGDFLVCVRRTPEQMARAYQRQHAAVEGAGGGQEGPAAGTDADEPAEDGQNKRQRQSGTSASSSASAAAEEPGPEREREREHKTPVIITWPLSAAVRAGAAAAAAAADDDDDAVEDIDDDDDDSDARAPRTAGPIPFNPVTAYNRVAVGVDAKIGGTAVFEDSQYVYVPVFVVERKTATDLASSIAGNSNKPDFVRYKEQKIRLKQFQALTGCKIVYVIEEYYKHCMKPKVGHLPEDRFNSTLVNMAVRDHIGVCHTANFFDTVRCLMKMCHCIVKHQVQNLAFTEIYELVRRGVARGTVPDRARDPAGHEAATAQVARTALLTQQLVECVVPTAKLPGDHSQIVSIRKKDNHSPVIRMQMMLMCMHGVSEKVAKVIQARYPTFPALIAAYEALGTTREKQDMLKSLETGSFSKKGTPLTLGPAKSRAVYEKVYALDTPPSDANVGAATVAAAAAAAVPAPAAAPAASSARGTKRKASAKGKKAPAPVILDEDDDDDAEDGDYEEPELK